MWACCLAGNSWRNWEQHGNRESSDCKVKHSEAGELAILTLTKCALYLPCSYSVLARRCAACLRSSAVPLWYDQILQHFLLPLHGTSNLSAASSSHLRSLHSWYVNRLRKGVGGVEISDFRWHQVVSRGDSSVLLLQSRYRSNLKLEHYALRILKMLLTCLFRGRGRIRDWSREKGTLVSAKPNTRSGSPHLHLA